MNRRYSPIRAIALMALSLLLCILCAGCTEMELSSTLPDASQEDASFSDLLPSFTDTAYTVINNNQPLFQADELTPSSFERYSELDTLGRCGIAVACIGQDIMPTEERGEIGSVKPSGWHSVKYDFVDGKYLYNRCHLIGFQLTGENANEQNLITGTRYMNTEGMLPFENMVADYVKETGNHVMYRVTPVFEDDNLVASGVTMEAYSIEDQGEGVCFYVYCHNIQPGVEIDYLTGDSREANSSDGDESESVSGSFILNTSSKKIHHPDCSAAATMAEKNRQEYNGSLQSLLNSGFTTCGECFE